MGEDMVARMRIGLVGPVISWVVVLLAACGAGAISGGKGVEIVAGPMFTPVGDEGEVVLWIQTNVPAGLIIELRCVEKGESKKYGRSTTASGGHIGTVRLGLSPGAAYDVRVWDVTRGKGGELLRLPRAIKGPPRVGQAGKYTIGFGSCTHQGRFASQPIFGAVVKERPDCFLFIGDNIYLPSDPSSYPTDRAGVRALYRRTYERGRRVPELQGLLRSTMSFAIWDDHDFGPNNSDRTWKWKEVALEVMNEYFPNRYGLPEARGCFYKFAWGDIDVFMLDDRTFRDPNGAADRKTFLGARQLAWLKVGLARSTATFKLIVCGNQMLSDGHANESWGVQFLAERDAFLRWAWDRQMEGLLFLSGDRHFAELIRKSDPLKKGPDLWELTSSPLANLASQFGKRFKNSDRVAMYSEAVNFGLLRFDTLVTPARVELLVMDGDGEVVIRREVTRGRAEEPPAEPGAEGARE